MRIESAAARITELPRITTLRLWLIVSSPFGDPTTAMPIERTSRTELSSIVTPSKYPVRPEDFAGSRTWIPADT